MGYTVARKVTIEVPDNVDEKLFTRLVIQEAMRLAKLISEWEDRMTDRNPTPEELELLKEIKKSIAKSQEKAETHGHNNRH